MYELVTAMKPHEIVFYMLVIISIIFSFYTFMSIPSNTGAIIKPDPQKEAFVNNKLAELTESKNKVENALVFCINKLKTIDEKVSGIEPEIEQHCSDDQDQEFCSGDVCYPQKTDDSEEYAEPEIDLE